MQDPIYFPSTDKLEEYFDKVVANYLANKPASTETYDELSSGTEGSHRRLFKLAEQFEQERYHLSPNEEAAFLDEEYLEWLENN